MKIGKTNVVAGLLAMFIAAVGGLVLGITFDANSVRNGDHILSLVRFYLREGHSHGMPIAMYNIIVGLVIDKLALTDRARKIASWAAIAGLLLPLGLAAKGAAGAPPDFPPVGMPGILGMFVSLAILLVGAFRMKREA